MTSAASELSSTIAAAIKELVALTKQLTNLVGVVKKNVEAYWAIKDSAGRRTAAENIKSLSESFGDLYMIQYTLAYEIDQIEAPTNLLLWPLTLSISTPTKLMKQYASLEGRFPICSSQISQRIASLLLDKKRVAKQLGNAVIRRGKMTP
jgi:hypothetical protein